MSQPPEKPREPWYRRLFRRERDVIIAEIGPGARDVIVGKNVIRIGTLVVPALPAVAALLFLASAAVLGLWWAIVPATMSGDAFNIAVAQFGQISGDRVSHSQDAALVSQTLFTSLKSELGRLNQDGQIADYTPRIWHDSMSLLEKRGSIGVIEGVDATARRAAACKRAEELGANVLVYGYLNVDTSPPTVEQEFCVRSLRRDLGDIAEVSSSDRLGEAVPVELPFDSLGKATANVPLRIRNTILTRVVIGLNYELAGRYTTALNNFIQALEYLQRQREPGEAAGPDGEDVLHYFIGREHFFLGQNATLDDAAREQHFATAEQEFNLALRNPNYVRARIGLGGVFYQRAIRQLQAQQPYEANLQRAIEEQRKAYQVAIGSDDTAAAVQAALALAGSYWRVGVLAVRDRDTAAAEQAFTQTLELVDFSEQRTGPDQHRFQAYAAMLRGATFDARGANFQMLGQTSDQRTALQAAQQYYQQCVTQGSQDLLDVWIKEQVVKPLCEPGLQRVQQALAAG